MVEKPTIYPIFNFNLIIKKTSVNNNRHEHELELNET